MLAARCLVLNFYLIDRYFYVHLTTNIRDVKLSTNVVYGRTASDLEFLLKLKIPSSLRFFRLIKHKAVNKV